MIHNFTEFEEARRAGIIERIYNGHNGRRMEDGGSGAKNLARKNVDELHAEGVSRSMFDFEIEARIQIACALLLMAIKGIDRFPSIEENIQRELRCVTRSSWSSP